MTRSDNPGPARSRLADAVAFGGLSLVLGAGVSLEFGVPNWRELSKRLWQRLPGMTDSILDALPHDTQSLPVLFELAEQRLGHRAYVDTLRECIYEKIPLRRKKDKGTTLGVVADAISNDHWLGAERRIARVITFNVDELLREALRQRRGDRGQYWRTMDHAVPAIPTGRGTQPVPIYHVHGFLPRTGAFVGLSEHRLVFTDSQYWDSGTSQASLANRTMNAALAESRCIFIGLSMTDPNLLRWLALRYNEVSRDVLQKSYRVRESSDSAPIHGAYEPSQIERRIEDRLSGHFWIRTAGDDPTGLLSEFLRHRGVEAVEISGWGDGSFAALFKECFETNGNPRKRRRRKPSE
jgi:SIR2-like domain